MFTGLNSEHSNSNTAPTVTDSISWQNLGAELVFTQDNSGKYISFWWAKAQEYDLDNQELVGSSYKDIFTPLDKEAYISKVRRVLKRRIPEQC